MNHQLVESEGEPRCRLLLPDWWRELRHDDGDSVQFECIGLRDDVAVGRIDVVVRTRRDDVDSLLLVRAQAELLKRDMRLSGAPVVPVDPPAGYDRAWVFEPTAHYNGSQFDAPIIAYENDEHVVMLALVGICKEESPEWWQVNKTTFELVRDSLRVGPATERSSPFQHAAHATA